LFPPIDHTLIIVVYDVLLKDIAEDISIQAIDRDSTLQISSTTTAPMEYTSQSGGKSHSLLAYFGQIYPVVRKTAPVELFITDGVVFSVELLFVIRYKFCHPTSNEPGCKIFCKTNIGALDFAMKHFPTTTARVQNVHCSLTNSNMIDSRVSAARRARFPSSPKKPSSEPLAAYS
jgi:hypothetical protein